MPTGGIGELRLSYYFRGTNVANEDLTTRGVGETTRTARMASTWIPSISSIESAAVPSCTAKPWLLFTVLIGVTSV